MNQPEEDRPVRHQDHPSGNPQKFVLKVDPATTVLVILALLFIPLIVAGFFSQ